MTVAVKPSRGRPGLGHDERIRDGGDAVVWQLDPFIPHARLYADKGFPRYRRASSCATPGLLGTLEVPDGARALLVYADRSYTTIPPGLWGLWATQGEQQ